MKTYLIVPAWSDQAGQCRIVARDGKIVGALSAYRSNPEPWKEVGLMGSRGQLVCLDAPAEVVMEFMDCQPLMAGFQTTGSVT